MMDEKKDEFRMTEDLNANVLPVQKPEKKINIWLILITFLLVGLLALNLLQFLAQKDQQKLAAERALTYEARVDQAQTTYLATQLKLDTLMDDYEQSVYKDESVDNIYQQQLRATEFNFIVLRYIASQNQEIIMLLSSLP